MKYLPTIDFTRLRAIDGDQRKGFEELVCQLFDDPKRPTVFQRIEGSGGDGGVELIEVDAKGNTASAWQAKYFFKIEKSQWDQIARSIATALNVHAGISSYTICLPIDLTGMRKAGKGQLTSGQWGKWKAVLGRAANGRRQASKVFLLTKKDLVGALVKKESAVPGFIRYWFGDGILDRKWWSTHRDRTRAAFAWSYDPSLSVWTPLRAALDAWAETATWRKSVSAFSTKLRNAIKATCALLLSTESEVVKSIADLASLGAELERMVDKQAAGDSPSAVVDLCSEILEVTDRARDYDENNKAKRYNQHLERCAAIASEFREEHSHAKAISSDKKVLVITGDSGSGKSHHVASFADAEGLAAQSGGGAAVVLTGSKGNEQHGLDLLTGVCDGCSWTEDLDSLLTALACEAASRGGYAVIMIDALNEASHWREWPEALALLLTRIKKVVGVRAVVTLRPEYQDRICQTIAQDPAVAYIFHRGFRGQTDRAIDAYMDHYHISRPATVALRSLADHPLFLKLFCMAFSGRTIPAGRDSGFIFGIIGLIDLWIDWLEMRLAERCDVDEKAKLARHSIQAIASLMIRAGREHVERSQVSAELQRLHPVTNHQKSLLAFLLGECVLEEHLADVERTEVECIRFSFQRLTELAVSRLLVDRWRQASDCRLDATLPHLVSENVSEETPLLSLPGCLDLIALLCAEKFSTELFEVMPQIGNQPTRHGRYVGPAVTAMDAALASGITSRSHRSLTTAFRSWLSSRLKEGDLLVWNEVIRSACYEAHPLSATTWLHDHLSTMPVLDRDAYWSVPLGNLYDPVRTDRYSRQPLGMYDPRVEHSVVKELLAWIEGLSHATILGISASAIREVALVLCWSFTASHRFLRDRASIALAKILFHHPRSSLDLGERFSACNDVYVIERVLAALYGAMLRNATFPHAEVLSWIQAHHASRMWSSDVVIRDYCLSIEAFCRFRSGLPHGSTLEFSKSLPIDFKKLKSRKHLDAKARKGDKQLGRRTSLEEINHSLTFQAGDFTNYCLYNATKFTQHLRTETPPTIRPQLTELSSKALEALKFLISKPTPQDVADDRDTPEFREASEYLRKKSIGLKQALMVSSEIVQRWMMTDLIHFYANAGSSLPKIDDYDSSWPTEGRDSHKAERIGKKHQWISLRSLLSRLGDNYWRVDGYGSRITWEEAPSPYGLGMREIDCSLPHEAAHLENHEDYEHEASTMDSWWSALSFDEAVLQGTAPADDWRRFAGCCLVKRWNPVRQESRAATSYVVLSQHGKAKGDLIGDNSIALKWMNYAVTSVLVQENEVVHALDILGSRSFMNRDLFSWYQDQMPQWIGEWPWHPALAGNEESARIERTRHAWKEGIPCIPATYNLLHEPGYDCSISESFSLDLPCMPLIRDGALAWSGYPGEFVKGDLLVVSDPALRRGAGPRGLVVHEGFLRDYLTKTRQSLISIGIAEWWHGTEEKDRKVAWGVTCLANALMGNGGNKGYAQHWALLCDSGGGEEDLVQQTSWNR